jgi:predicted oxidoreductase
MRTIFMNDSFPPEIQQSIQQSLQDIALQMGQSLDEVAAEWLYREAKKSYINRSKTGLFCTALLL